MAKRKVSTRQLLDSATLIAETKADEVVNERFTAFVDGKMIHPLHKPFLVHVRGKEPPFDSQLEPYWNLQRSIKRVS